MPPLGSYLTMATLWTTLVNRYHALRERRWFRWLVDIAMVVVILAAVGAWQTRDHLSAVAAPAVVLPRLGGGSLDLASLRGKPVLAAFWAPWCSVCKTQSQNLGWVRSIAGERAEVISIAVGYDSLSEVEAYVRERGVEYPVLLGNERLAREFRVEAFPTLYFLDADGSIVRSAAGYTTTLGMLWRLFL